jgi:hypothetical protein
MGLDWLSSLANFRAKLRHTAGAWPIMSPSATQLVIVFTLETTGNIEQAFFSLHLVLPSYPLTLLMLKYLLTLDTHLLICTLHLLFFFTQRASLHW